jgi:hypothetical protein
MDIGIFELNDAGLRLSFGNQHSNASPGFATVEGDNLVLGTAAMRRARLNPLQTNYQFWHRLSAEPLPIHNNRYRHHADLAYSQLLAVHSEVSDCDKIIFALPGNFTREQMALLLGIVDQCPFKAVGLVDSAVAASALDAKTGNCLHLEAQLHQCVFTLIRTDGNISRQQIEVLPSAGLLTLRDRFAKSVADQFVDQSRFDPLHSAVTEQSIYDQLPSWLALSFEETDMILEVAGKTAKVSRNQLIAPLSQYFQQISELALKLLNGRGQILVGHQLAKLPGFMEVLNRISGRLGENPIALTENAVVNGVQQNINAIVKGEGDLAFIQTLPANASSQSAFSTLAPSSNDATREKTVASHVLVGNRAFPLGNAPVFINANQQLSVSARASGETIGILQGQADGISLLPQGKIPLYRNQTSVNDNILLHSGDCLSAKGVEGQLQFIEVVSNGS